MYFYFFLALFYLIRLFKKKKVFPRESPHATAQRESSIFPSSSTFSLHYEIIMSCRTFISFHWNHQHHQLAKKKNKKTTTKSLLSSTYTHNFQTSDKEQIQNKGRTTRKRSTQRRTKIKEKGKKEGTGSVARRGVPSRKGNSTKR